MGLTLLGLSFVSGALIWWSQWSDVGADEAPLISGNWRRLHGALNPFLWGFLGYLTHQHIRIGWRNRACLISGGAMLLVLAGLALSGTHLIYGANEISRATVVGIHRIFGAAIPLVLAAHWVEAIFWAKRLEQSTDGTSDVN